MSSGLIAPESPPPPRWPGLRAASSSLCLAGLALLSCPHFAAAKSKSVAAVADERKEERAPSSRSLRAWSSLNALSAKLGVVEERQAGLARLSERGTPEAVRMISAWLDLEPDLDARSWLEVTHALAPLAKHADARRWLIRILVGAPLVPKDKNADPETKVRELSRATAAMALAKAGDPESVGALLSALGQGEHSTRWARDALLAHPPVQLTPLLQRGNTRSVELVTTLDELGDQRAFDTLREVAREGTAELQAAAILALFHQGQLETLEVAQHWARTASSHAGLLGAATEILLACDDPAAEAAFEALLGLDSARALTLALRFPRPAMSQPLVGHFAQGSFATQTQILEVLGLLGTAGAVQLLADTLTNPQHAASAGHALAHCPGRFATEALLAALALPKAAAAATRALVVRGWATHQEWARLTQRLQSMSRDKDPALRALGQWGLSVASLKYARLLLATEDWTKVSVAMSTLWVHGTALAQPALRLMLSTKERRVKAALAAALSNDEATSALSTGELHAILNDFPALQAVIAPRLTSHHEVRFPARSAALLASDEPSVQAAALLGLARSPDGDADAKLEAAYFGAIDVDVRRAAVAAMADRTRGNPHSRALQFALDFDPDATTRSRARSLTQPRQEASPDSVWLSGADSSPGDLLLMDIDAGRTVLAMVPIGGELVLLGQPEPLRVRTAKW